jgi:hypothetical protein
LGFVCAGTYRLVIPVTPFATLWLDKALIMPSGITKYPKGNTGWLFETGNHAGEAMGQ